METPLYYLPPEILSEIFSFSWENYVDLLSISNVCRKFCEVLGEFRHWEKFYEMRWGKKEEDKYFIPACESTDTIERNKIGTGKVTKEDVQRRIQKCMFEWKPWIRNFKTTWQDYPLKADDREIYLVKVDLKKYERYYEKYGGGATLAPKGMFDYIDTPFYGFKPHHYKYLPHTAWFEKTDSQEVVMTVCKGAHYCGYGGYYGTHDALILYDKVKRKAIPLPKIIPRFSRVYGYYNVNRKKVDENFHTKVLELPTRRKELSSRRKLFDEESYKIGNDITMELLYGFFRDGILYNKRFYVEVLKFLFMCYGGVENAQYFFALTDTKKKNQSMWEYFESYRNLPSDILNFKKFGEYQVNDYGGSFRMNVSGWRTPVANASDPFTLTRRRRKEKEEMFEEYLAFVKKRNKIKLKKKFSEDEDEDEDGYSSLSEEEEDDDVVDKDDTKFPYKIVFEGPEFHFSIEEFCETQLGSKDQRFGTGCLYILEREKNQKSLIMKKNEISSRLKILLLLNEELVFYAYGNDMS